MNKRNFVTGFTPDKADFDALQDDLESGINFTAAAVAGMGIKEGFEFTLSDSNAIITTGEGFDGLGRPLKSIAEITLNLGAITRPGVGVYKWITVALKYKVKEEGTVTDISNTSWPYLIKDSLEIIVLEGEEDSLENIIKPAFEVYEVPLLDIRMDNATVIENLYTENNRKPVISSVSELTSRLDAILDLAYPIGVTYTQFPGDLDPASLGLPGTWSNVSSEIAGDFIRFEGGTSLAFEGGEQADAFQGHQFRRQITGGQAGVNLAEQYQAAGLAYINVEYTSYYSTIAELGSYGTPRVDIETRPINRTVRKWRRTA